MAQPSTPKGVRKLLSALLVMLAASAMVAAACTPKPGGTPTSTTAPGGTPTTTTAPGGPASDEPYIELSTASSWDGGRSVDAVLHNPGPTRIDGWTVEFDWPVEVTSMWSAISASTFGRVAASNEAWNAEIPAGGSASFGFSATAPDTLPAPSNGLCNGDPCDVVISEPTSPTTTTTTTVPGATTSTTTTTTVPQGPVPDVEGRIAPYVDMGLWPTADLVQFATGSGVNRLTMAFVQAGAPCEPMWFGIVDLDDPEYDMGGRIAALRAAGGDVIVSFGGAAGIELAQTCTDETALKNAYRSVIDRYDLTSIDLDIEGAAVAEPESVHRRSRAIAALQADLAAEGVDLEVSLTLPVLPQGLTHNGLATVQSAADAGVDLVAVNLMAMDYGDSAAPDPDGKMGQYAIDAANNTAAQLATVWPALSAQQRLQRVGLTPMIGRNDVVTEFFYTADAVMVGEFAKANGLGRLAWWSTHRDRPCAGGPSPWASPVCHSGTTPEWGFAAAFLQGVGVN